MKIKTGKAEIVYLLTKVIEQYERQTGHQITRNSNRKNYEDVAKVLSDISNELPNTWETLQHEKYVPDYNPEKSAYPFRKYDITGNQVKDAYFNQIVSNPRSFLVDACYIYLYGMGRKGFEKSPVDTDLLEVETKKQDKETGSFENKNEILKQQIEQQQREHEKKLQAANAALKKQRSVFLIALASVIVLLAVSLVGWVSTKKEWRTVQKDMNLVSYKPTPDEIDSLEGIWLCYTGSPQARSSDPNRYHMVVSNVVNVKYKNGYFTFLRYGASFDHIGYMQFEAPGLVSIHSYVKNGDSVESPRHSLMRLDEKTAYFSVISASWNFDVGARNSIIGIREVYIKQGKSGRIEEVMNTIENASCKCKILKWHQQSGKLNTFYLKNELLDSLPDKTLKSLIDEKSILLRVPQDGLIYAADSIIKQKQQP